MVKWFNLHHFVLIHLALKVFPPSRYLAYLFIIFQSSCIYNWFYNLSLLGKKNLHMLFSILSFSLRLGAKFSLSPRVLYYYFLVKIFLIIKNVWNILKKIWKMYLVQIIANMQNEIWIQSINESSTKFSKIGR